MTSTQRTTHRWKFARIGGLDQVILETADDLLNLDQLDQKLWVALSCPVKSLEYDEDTLQLLDTDNDGRIRVAEITGAIKWLSTRLADVSVILNPQPQLPPGAINAGTPEGALLLSTANLLISEGKAGLSVAGIAETRKQFLDGRFNGDGVISADTTDTPELKQLVENIIATQGAAQDLSGKPGVTQEKIDAFYDAVAAHIARNAEAAATQVFVFGKTTPAAHAAFKAVREKIDDYFERCRLASFDPRTLAALNRPESDYAAIIARDLKPGDSDLAGFPLAKITPDKPLALAAGINPAWTTAVGAFLSDTMPVAFNAGKTDITAAEWESLKTKFGPYENWLAANAGSPITALGDARIEEIHATAAADRDALGKLVAQDKALESESLALSDINRLVRYYSQLGVLLRNFVNFADFYSLKHSAIFQAGVLYLDSRSCELCIRVDDPAAHSVLAALSRACIAYCELKRAGEAPVKIAACFTQGDSDFLMVGRNGVFYDMKGRDWDATITKLVSNPISVREAFWSPYKKLIRTIEEHLAKRGAAAEAATGAKLDKVAENTANADKLAATSATATPEAPKKIDVGTVAAIGVAAGALTGAIAAIATGIARLAPWQILLIPVALLLIISGPSMFIAWLKLRQRTLGPILDAAGWAVNGRVKINVPLGTSLTDIATLPDGSQRTLRDPYEDKAAKRRKRRIVLVLVLAALAAFGAWAWIDHIETNTWIWDRLLSSK
ncbi:hypothetical protein [Ereboglobus luteus]|uniref:hypothetical protein n=1 Tax=Ereboglobus luteus TaxID=1796921 RepID=UPI001374E831|nr:hypothetical protein [Ereboglobus luteus]